MNEQLNNTHTPNTDDQLDTTPEQDFGQQSTPDEQAVEPVEQNNADFSAADTTQDTIAMEEKTFSDEATVAPDETTSEAAPSIAQDDQSSSKNTGNDDDQPKPKDRHKVVWMGLVASLLLLVGGTAAFLTLNNRSSEQVVTNEEPVAVVEEKVTTLGAEVAFTEGVVEISRGGAANWVGTPGSESVAHLDYIRTKEDSRAIILFDDGSIARLDENTEVYLSSLEREGLELTLIDGQVYTRVVDSEELTFTVATANERFESLGTAFKTSTDGTKDTLDVYQSAVEVASESIEVTEGNSYNTEDKKLSAIDLSELKNDKFAQWNKEKDSENELFKDKLGVLVKEVEKETEEAPAPSIEQRTIPKITLSGKTDTKGVKLTWTVENVSATNGFKIVRASNISPTYGKDDAQYVGSKARDHMWWDENGGSHYYRVCVYKESDSCDTYSNAVLLTSPKIEKEVVKSGQVVLTIDGSTINWSLVGGNSPHGFKILISAARDPIYPEDSVLYVGPTARTAILNEKAGTYRVKICKYTALPDKAGCVDYSNQVTYSVTN